MTQERYNISGNFLQRENGKSHPGIAREHQSLSKLTEGLKECGYQDWIVNRILGCFSTR